MTPEQTLNWLAQQHFDQCLEERPVQYWIRQMKSELPEQEPWKGLTKEEINSALSKYQNWYEFAAHLENILKEKNQ